MPRALRLVATPVAWPGGPGGLWKRRSQYTQRLPTPPAALVLETGNPVAMPWQHGVKAILAAWYPEEAGGQAIAEVLTGEVNPSVSLEGRLFGR
jgi:ABC-type Fe3+-hydroxamate transport system substrate-binding protein